jgi:hypothetical protein
MGRKFFNHRKKQGGKTAKKTQKKQKKPAK